MVRYFLAALLGIVSFNRSDAQQGLHFERDLREEWLVHSGNEYVPAAEGDIANTIYLRISTARLAGKYLMVDSESPYFIFLNGNLAGRYSGESRFSIDSLAEVTRQSGLLLAIYQPNLNLRALHTHLLKTGGVDVPNYYRPDTWLRDFATVAGLLIVTFFVLISRMNPKLAADYLSFGGIVALRQSEDVHANARLTNSSNLQFYFGSSLLLGYYLLIIFQHVPDGYTIALLFKAENFWMAIGQWLKISIVVMGAFSLKIALIFGLTRLFDMRGLTRVHFFNWMRLLLVVIGAATIVLFIYFISRGQNPGVYVGFLIAIVVALCAWVVILFLRLTGVREHSMFHLFSYICATEMIPLLITIKVFFR